MARAFSPGTERIDGKDRRAVYHQVEEAEIESKTLKKSGKFSLKLQTWCKSLM